MGITAVLTVGIVLGLALASPVGRLHQLGSVRVHGEVFSGEFDDGLENATVSLVGNGRRLSGLTGPSGTYSIDKVPPGDYSVEVDCPGWASYRSNVTIEAKASELDFPIYVNMYILADGALSGVRGVISDSDGRPIEDATVEAVGAFEKTVASKTWTGPDGRYKLGLPRAGQFVIYASKAGFVAQPKIFMLAGPWTSGFNFELSRLPADQR